MSESHQYVITLDGKKVGKKYYSSLGEARSICDKDYYKRLRASKGTSQENYVNDDYIIVDLTSKDFTMPYNPSVEGGIK